MDKSDPELRKLMNAEITSFDLPKQLAITNERMLAVRDDLTFVLNARANDITIKAAHQHSDVGQWIGKLETRQMAALTKLSKEFWERTNEHEMGIRNIENELIAIRMHLERRWWKTVWVWLKDWWPHGK